MDQDSPQSWLTPCDSLETAHEYADIQRSLGYEAVVVAPSVTAHPTWPYMVRVIRGLAPGLSAGRREEL